MTHDLDSGELFSYFLDEKTIYTLKTITLARRWCDFAR